MVYDICLKCILPSEQDVMWASNGAPRSSRCRWNIGFVVTAVVHPTWAVLASALAQGNAASSWKPGHPGTHYGSTKLPLNLKMPPHLISNMFS